MSFISRYLTPKNAVRSTLLASCLTLAAPITAFAETTLNVAQGRDPQNLDPIDTFRLAWGSIASNVFDGLVFRGEDLQLQPGLATNWEFLDNETRIRFSLREGVEFHNGEPFNADAVKYTFDRLLGEEGAKGPQRGNYTSIREVVVVDEYTVDFMMERPDPVLITKLAGYGAMIVPPKYIEEVGEDAFDMKPVGTGPFKVAEYTPTIGVKLEKSDTYWNGEAKVDNVNIRFIPEDATRMAELLSGGIDISLNIPTPSVETIKQSDVVDLVNVDGPSVVITRFNTERGITTDPRVRKAISMAVDRETIIQALLGGLASPISSAQGEKSFGNDSSLKPYPYDPEAAKRLLKEAGVAAGTEITLDIPSSNDTFREIAQVIAAYLEQVGLKLNVRTHETSVFFNEIVTNGKSGEMFYFGWGGWTFDFDNTAYLLYHTGERNNPYIDDAKLNALLDEERATYNTDVRRDALQKVAAYAHEHALDLPLYNLSTLYGVNKRVEGFVPAPDDRARYMDVTLK
ncbi:ABC transporter substrate-binding protein [Cognatishimia activa]|uniref:ABC transporter substrate-binding protein n=1 Tax=Cognatishimia activa TaxID=1715691 RepID=UPI00222EC992|nr:ABC transporter substrate-binding protein [Cognatishimia activa]UZD89768.1 ABC transporter substrate-binding protein [Cognatishimia activa]